MTPDPALFFEPITDPQAPRGTYNAQVTGPDSPTHLVASTPRQPLKSAPRAAERRADFVRAWRESAGVRLLFAIRGFGERTVSLLAGHEDRKPPPSLVSMRLADMPTHADWVLSFAPRHKRTGCVGR